MFLRHYRDVCFDNIERFFAFTVEMFPVVQLRKFFDTEMFPLTILRDIFFDNRTLLSTQLTSRAGADAAGEGGAPAGADRCQETQSQNNSAAAQTFEAWTAHHGIGW